MTDEKPTLEKLSRQLTELQDDLRFLQIRSLAVPVVPARDAELRLALLRACNGFKRLGRGCVGLSALTFAAFLAALFNNKLTQLPAFIIVTAALFLAAVGYLFFMQADSLDLGGRNEP